MKKTYINPTLIVVEIKYQAILAGSLDAPVQNGGTLSSRGSRFSGWDEDFDSEE